MREVEFHQAYSSDLKRALQTCQNILAHNKKSIITSNHIVQDERLREQNFGVYENRPITSVSLKFEPHIKCNCDL